MQKSIIQSEVIDSKEVFGQTFGRRCMPQYQQPSYSQRNNFEQQKIHQNYENIKKQIGWQKIMRDEKYVKRQEIENLNLKKSKQFQKIDAINDKICGLIKSISASCHKKVPISSKSISFNPSKQSVYQQPKFNKINYLDYQKTQKKKSSLVEPIKVNDFQISTFQNKRSKYNFQDFERQNKEQKHVEINSDEIMEQRLKKINDKINKYENRVKAKQLQKYQNPIKQTLKQQKDFSNITKQNFSRIDNFQLRSRNFDNIKANEKQNLQRQKDFNEVIQIKNIDKTDGFNKKGSYFHQKYTHIEQKKVINQKYMDKKYHQQNEKNRVRPANNIFNTQLLSYKTAFIKQIVKQINFDQDFRHAKHMFGGIECLFDEPTNIPKHKWNLLQQQLKNQGFNMSINEVRQIFTPRDDQIDPFMSVSHSHDELAHSLIFAYRNCQKNWNQNIYHSWSEWELNESKFTEKNIGKKGFVKIQDLTFYLNTQLDGNYRNRDLLLIFNRLKPHKAHKYWQQQQSIKFKDIIDKLISP